MDFKLNELSSPAKTLILCFILALMLGYGVALLQAYEHTGFDSAKVILEYRGSSNPDLMAFPKPYSEILQNTHAHALSVPLVYFLLSLIFLGTRLNKKTKSILIAFLFMGFFLEYSSIWLLRYVSPSFIYGLFIANGITSFIYLFMSSRVIYDLK